MNSSLIAVAGLLLGVITLVVNWLASSKRPSEAEIPTVRAVELYKDGDVLVIYARVFPGDASVVFRELVADKSVELLVHVNRSRSGDIQYKPVKSIPIDIKVRKSAKPFDVFFSLRQKTASDIGKFTIRTNYLFKPIKFAVEYSKLKVKVPRKKGVISKGPKLYNDYD